MDDVMAAAAAAAADPSNALKDVDRFGRNRRVLFFDLCRCCCCCVDAGERDKGDCKRGSCWSCCNGMDEDTVVSSWW